MWLSAYKKEIQFIHQLQVLILVVVDVALCLNVQVQIRINFMSLNPCCRGCGSLPGQSSGEEVLRRRS